MIDALAIKEVSEASGKLKDCPLGRAAEQKSLAAPESEYDKPLYEKNCPRENGGWSGERGDSIWYPAPDYIPLKANPEGKTWKEILDKHGIDGVEFKEGEPDFRDVAKGTAEIEDFSADRSDNFDRADAELAKQRECASEEVRKWRKDNGYTWHECGDMKTMQKVPSEVHNNIQHQGGIAKKKELNSMKEGDVGK